MTSNLEQEQMKLKIGEPGCACSAASDNLVKINQASNQDSEWRDNESERCAWSVGSEQNVADPSNQIQSVSYSRQSLAFLCWMCSLSKTNGDRTNERTTSHDYERTQENVVWEDIAFALQRSIGTSISKYRCMEIYDDK